MPSLLEIIQSIDYTHRNGVGYNDGFCEEVNREIDKHGDSQLREFATEYVSQKKNIHVFSYWLATYPGEVVSRFCKVAGDIYLSV